MKSFPISVLLVAFLPSITYCTSFPLLIYKITLKPPPEHPITFTDPSGFEESYYLPLLAVAASSLLLIFYGSIRSAGFPKKMKFEEEDIELLGLAATALDDLWYRLKTKANINRGGSPLIR